MFKVRLPNWKRFSLRTLFVLMTVCCLVVGMWSVYVNPYRMQAHSIAVVERLEGQVTKEAAKGPDWPRWLVTRFLGKDAYVHVTKVDLSNRKVDDKALRQLTGLSHLKVLNLDNTQITDDGLDALRSLRALETLSMRYTNVTNRIAKYVASLPNLRVVQLTGTKISDEAIPALAQRPTLKELFIRWTNISNDGADQLRTALPNCAIYHHALVTPLAAASENPSSPAQSERRP